MSFSSEVKEELMKHYTKQAHCQRAELEALLTFDEQGVKKDNQNNTYIFNFLETKKTYTVKTNFDLTNDCCKRAYLRGAFIATGSISSPEKTYRFDITCENSKMANFLVKIMASFNLHPKITTRRNKFVVYLKEAVEISDMLAIIEANVAMMNFENARIIKEMRGSVNRQVNCETANLNKTISASMKQVEDINFIKQKNAFNKLDENLKQVANARLKNPDATLEELGRLLNPPVGKSGVNHRLRKISEIAKELRSNQ